LVFGEYDIHTIKIWRKIWNCCLISKHLDYRRRLSFGIVFSRHVNWFGWRHGWSKKFGGMNNQSKSSRQPKLKMPSTLFLALSSWNLGRLQLNNLILLTGKQTLANWSPKTLSPKKKNRRWSPSPIWLAQTFDARLPPELNPMLEGIETFTTLFHQLHRWLCWEFKLN